MIFIIIFCYSCRDLHYSTEQSPERSQFHGCEPEEDFASYVTFEGGLAIFISNPISVGFSVNLTSTLRGIALLQYNFSRYTQCRVQELWLVLNFVREEGL